MDFQEDMHTKPKRREFRMLLPSYHHYHCQNRAKPGSQIAMASSSPAPCPENQKSKGMQT